MQNASRDMQMVLHEHIRQKIKLRDTTRTKNYPKLSEMNPEII